MAQYTGRTGGVRVPAAPRLFGNEQPDQEQTEGEAADVREVGDAFAAAELGEPGRGAEDSCSTNQKPSRHTAGTSTIVTKKMMNTSVSTRARGYSRM